MQPRIQATKPATCRHSFQHRTLIGHISELEKEVLRLREDNLQLRAALSIYSDLARQSLISPLQP
jgi:hypothetical protein